MPVLRKLCEYHSLYKAALREVKRFPLSKEGAGVLKLYCDEHDKLLDKCLLTPEARTRMKIGGNDKQSGVSSRQRGAM